MTTMTHRLYSLTIDSTLLRDAERLLGTSGDQETVERALREAIDLEHRRHVAEIRNPMSEEELQAMRDAQRRFGIDPTC